MASKNTLQKRPVRCHMHKVAPLSAQEKEQLRQRIEHAINEQTVS